MLFVFRQEEERRTHYHCNSSTVRGCFGFHHRHLHVFEIQKVEGKS